MPVHVYWPHRGALAAKIDAIRAAAKPGSPPNKRALGDIRKIVIEANTEKVLGHGLEGVDRFGKPLRPLAPSSWKNRKGLGPVLAPRGLLSRVITTFFADWKIGPSGTNTLVMGWRDFVSKKGFPIMIAHLNGAKRAGTKWILPKRDIGGIGPAQGTYWQKIRDRVKRLGEDIVKGH